MDIEAEKEREVAYRAVEIANEFIGLPQAGGLTQMQLQKLVYISNGWNLALSGVPLVAESPEAWDYGPVYPALYEHTKFFGRAVINRKITPDDSEAARFFGGAARGTPPYKAELTERERAIILQVWKRYGSMSGTRLSGLTHQPNTPWFDTYKGKGRSAVIDRQLIKAHYDQLAQSAQQAA